MARMGKWLKSCPRQPEKISNPRALPHKRRSSAGNPPGNWRSPCAPLPLMKPNWLLLTYLVVEGFLLSAIVALASLKAAFTLYARLGGTSVPNIDRLLVSTAVIGLGILPWAGIIAFGRMALRPRKSKGFRVQKRAVGPVVATLTALDDEEAAGEVVRDFRDHAGVASVIVVDNGSVDRTEEVATTAGAHVVREPKRGYGHACQRALREGLRSGYPIVVLCEADRTFRAGDIEQFVAYLQYADLVVGSRTHGALLNSDSQLNSFFILGNLFVAKLLQARYWDWLTGGRVRLTDAGCTYMAIREDALRRILPFLEAGGSQFVPHLLMVALERELNVVQVPVTFWKRVGVSKGGNANWRKGFSLGCAMLWQIFTYRVRRTPRPELIDVAAQMPVRRDATNPPPRRATK